VHIGDSIFSIEMLLHSRVELYNLLELSGLAVSSSVVTPTIFLTAIRETNANITKQ
jgi:hypothetical protein